MRAPDLALETVPICEPEDVRVTDNGAIVAAIVDEPDALADEPADALADRPAAGAAESEQRPRFKLRAALARCKTHPTARLKIEFTPGKAVKINGARPLGDVGRCVEDVLKKHPPPRAVTLKP